MSTSDSAKTPAGEERLFAQSGFADLYERALVAPLFRPWVQPLLDELQVGPGDRVLDVACGTGVVARLARERVGATGAVVGVDADAGMLAVAQRVAPAIDWRRGDAGALPLRPDEKFDVVVCQQGFQFFPDRAAAARQMHAALVKGGQLGASAWRPDEEFPLLRDLRGVVERRLGPITDARHALGDPAPLEAVLREAGFRDVRSKRHAQRIRFDDGAAFVRLNAMALISMSAASSELDDRQREELASAIVRDSAGLVQLDAGGALTYELGTNVVLAQS